MTILITPAPTEHKSLQAGQFLSLTQALDSAAAEQTGMNFYAPRGELKEVLLYSALADEARLVGAKLLATGLSRGDRVGLIAETEADFIRAFMGCLYAHLVPCPMPLPTAFGASGAYSEHLKRIIAVCDASAIVVPEAYHELVFDHLTDTNLVFLGSVTDLGDETAALPAGDPDPNDLAYLQFSSGTTKAPKGVAISHRALMANVEGMALDALKMGPMDRGVSWLPFYHDMGLVGCMILPIATHMSMDYLATRDFIRRPELWMKMISNSQATVSYAPSFGYELAARRRRPSGGLDLSSWRIAGIGGDMIKRANLTEFTDVHAPFGFRETSYVPSYGMAEVSLALTFVKLGDGAQTQRLDLKSLEKGKALTVSEDADNARDFATCGTVLPNHQIEVRDGTGEVLNDNQVGLVFAKGPSVMIGYYGDEAETSRMLDTDGWLNTGDVGYMSNGQLVLTGRAKDLIIINGRNIWPQDIEWSVEQSVDDVREGRVAAFGVVDPLSNDEEYVTVVVECRMSEEEKREALRQQVDALVRSVCGVAPKVALSKPGTLPRTSSGKLSRAKTQLMYLEGTFD